MHAQQTAAERRQDAAKRRACSGDHERTAARVDEQEPRRVTRRKNTDPDTPDTFRKNRKQENMKQT